ncbi:MAG: tRNA (adenosine(37)-N6)-threonylcarbamoyltransferase complex dimerization subunit type 1 TsaB [Actinomycetota bacterium]|nr:tRNA (adenosine(37)-N6)-threonylcarbamoyltransferase complex dimerization subunit type 1 TsaB [Actinomycetota bacterium]
MLVLGLDTSTPAVSVALVDVATGEVVAEPAPADGRQHGELLAGLVRDLLAEPRVRQDGLHGVVVGVGPGPFTGLRVGMVSAAVLGDALGAPVHGVCSLDGLAGEVDGPVVAVTDARRREVYWARYNADGDRLEGPDVDLPATLAARLPPNSVLVGAGAGLYRDVFGAHRVLDQPRYPRAAALVRVAAGRLREGEAPGPLVPLYLRRPDATEPAAAKRVGP